MGSWLLGALALMLIVEGLMPLFSPNSWRSTMQRALQLSDGQLRFLGLCSIAAGLVLLWLFGGPD